MPGNAEQIKPFDNFVALDGHHCWSSSFAKTYRYFNCPLSEEMLLGLGSWMKHPGLLPIRSLKK